MPFDEGLRLDDHERASPVKELTETNHDKPENSARSLRSDLAFLEQRQLLSEKKIFRDEGDAGAKEQAEEGQQLRILQVLACQGRIFAEHSPHTSARITIRCVESISGKPIFGYSR